MKLPGWARQPLVHFVIGGAAIFALFAWIGEPVDPASRSIVVTREQQAQLSLQFARTMQRPPTDAELDTLVQRWLRDEVLYREALRLGLDQDDTVVRRRLSQKMDFIAASEAETAMPDDAELQRWLAANPERFTGDIRYSFDQLWFAELRDVYYAKDALAAGADWRELGEPISVRRSFTDALRSDVAAQFTKNFADRLDGLDPGEAWQGPVPSGLGWHLVRLSAKEPGQLPPLGEVRADVLSDWRYDTAQDRRERAAELLRGAYQIEIER